MYCFAASDPRVWSRDDVATFLRWCEREFDLPHFDMEMFQMNGKKSFGFNFKQTGWCMPAQKRRNMKISQEDILEDLKLL